MEDPPDFSGLSISEGFPLDRVLGVLSDPIALYTVTYLSVGEAVTLEELADVVTGWVHADSGQAAGLDERDRIRLLLYHVYLPRLAAVDVIEFDADDQTAVLLEQSAELETVLDWARRLE